MYSFVLKMELTVPDVQNIFRIGQLKWGRNMRSLTDIN